MAKVSIIIPLYNAEKYIEQTLCSALEQTYFNTEIIIVDDGSDDNSMKLVNKMVNQGAKIKIFKQENKGACAARNLGITKSTGEFIQFLDADDILHPRKIEHQITLLNENNKNAIALSSLYKFKNSIDEGVPANQEIYKNYDSPIEFLTDSWEGKGKGQTSLWLCHREIIEKAGYWDESLKLNQDGEFFCRVLLNAGSIKFSKGSVVYYRTDSSNSVSKGKSYEKAHSLLHSYISYKNNVLKFEDNYKVRHALMRNFLSFIYELYPKYPDLLKLADENIKKLGFKNYEPVGGETFKKISSVIGFYNALRLRMFFNQ